MSGGIQDEKISHCDLKKVLNHRDLKSNLRVKEYHILTEIVVIDIVSLLYAISV